MTGDRLTAEDLTQETFIPAYQKLDTYRGEARFYTWLYRIAANLCLRHLDRESRLTFADWPAERPSGPRPQQDVRDNSHRHVLHSLPETTPDGC
jgi:RNA polymerase sigma factor (sigma-70 family)